jgi:hypothetical protein
MQKNTVQVAAQVVVQAAMEVRVVEELVGVTEELEQEELAEVQVLDVQVENKKN